MGGLWAWGGQGVGGSVQVGVAPGVLRINIGQSPSPVNYPEFESLAAVNYLGRIAASSRPRCYPPQSLIVMIACHATSDNLQ